MHSVYLFFITIICLPVLSIYKLDVIVNAHPQVSKIRPIISPITETCLECICKAISSCDLNLKCTGDSCGPFRISQRYWIDSDSPVLKGDDPKDELAFSRCANDQKCSKDTAKNYLTKFAQDCNGDGTIDCLDFASVHKLGGYYNCSKPLDDDMYKDKFYECFKNVSNRENHVQANIIIPLNDTKTSIRLYSENYYLQLNKEKNQQLEINEQPIEFKKRSPEVKNQRPEIKMQSIEVTLQPSNAKNQTVEENNQSPELKTIKTPNEISTTSKVSQFFKDWFSWLIKSLNLKMIRVTRVKEIIDIQFR